MEQEFDLKTYLDILRRRIPHLVIPFLAVFAAVGVAVYLLPPVYHASATILVESQQIPSDLARSTVTSAAAERIAVIRQRLMTRSNLLQIVRDFGLYSGSGEDLSPTEIVERMREAAAIEQIDIGNRRSTSQQAVAFSVSFEYGTAQHAARVANQFVELILEQNIRARTTRASKTYKFFEQQVGDLEKDLTLKEASIVKFKSENEDALPDSLAYRRALLTDLRSRIPAIDQKIQALTEQRELLKAGEEVVVADPIEKQISELELQLKQYQEIYSERHPSVKRVRNRIAALKKALDAGTTTDVAKDDEPQDASAETPDVSREVATKLASIERQLGALDEQRRKEQERITIVEETLAKTPRVEIALNALTREYKALEARLAQARTKMAEAATGEQLEEDRQAERFEVIERASAPSRPAKPDRPKLVLAGFILSIAAGVGAVILFELLDRSVRTSADLQKRLQIRPLSTIPFVVTDADRRRRKKLIFATLTGGTVAACAAAVMMHVFYRPLDVIWYKVVDKLPI